MSTAISGSALKYAAADDVNTDVIWPGKYTYVKLDPPAMAERAMETFDPDFPQKAKQHSVLVVGKNFGCGSSREQASQCLKYAGIEAVVAVSFSRIFYRNSMNLGLPVIECPEASAALQTGDPVSIDLEAGALISGERTFPFAPFPPFVLELIHAGGLIAQIRARRERDQGGTP
ncbi:MAG: 3-isopropylmalate dehydratase [Planctomycetota bacterium]